MSDSQHMAYLLANNALRTAKAEAANKFVLEMDCYDVDDPDDLNTATRITEQAFDLCHEANKIARQMMSSHTHELAIAELRRRRPGYSDETYIQAISDSFSHASR